MPFVGLCVICLPKPSCTHRGTYYVNALRATLDIYRGTDTTSTLLAVAQPLEGQVSVDHGAALPVPVQGAAYF